ncbi:MAG: nucleotidyltransferase family protein [Brachymonas sp.]|nr:nucleotidyltransferase family protein [Brachymonas sp.]
MLNLAEQIREALATFASADIKPALIGGLAVVAHKVVRATKDVDFLLEAEDADKVHEALLNLGYQCIYRSQDAANYVRGTEGLDFSLRPSPFSSSPPRAGRRTRYAYGSFCVS